MRLGKIDKQKTGRHKRSQTSHTLATYWSQVSHKLVSNWFAKDMRFPVLGRRPRRLTGLHDGDGEMPARALGLSE